MITGTLVGPVKTANAAEKETSTARWPGRPVQSLRSDDPSGSAPSVRWYERRHSFGVEMAFLVLVIVAWQAIRVPLEGRVDVAVAHARSILELESDLSLRVEPTLIRFGEIPALGRILHVAYANLHIPVLFAFFAAVYTMAPHRYPFLRSVFVLSFIPAVFVIGLYPTAPPRWLPELRLGVPPAQEQLAGTVPALLQNSTAAAASQHFAVSVLVGVGVLWLFPRSPFAWLVALYPLLIFVVIVGTGNHYVLDCIVGTATLVFGAAVARSFHGNARRARRRATRTASRYDWCSEVRHWHGAFCPSAHPQPTSGARRCPARSA